LVVFSCSYMLNIDWDSWI